MSNEYFYCKVKEGGPTEAAWKKFEARYLEKRRERNALAKRLGATGYFANPRAIEGFKFAGEQPKGWIQCKDSSACCYPRASTPENKALRAEMKIPEPVVSEFGADMGCAMFWQFPRIRHMLCERIGDQLLLLVPKMDDEHKKPDWEDWKLPKDCKLIPTSAYHKLKEDHDAKSKRPAAKRTRAKKA